MAFYQIEPERAALHGTFSRELPPCLTVTSEDTVRFRTLEANWSMGPADKAGLAGRRTGVRAA